MPIGDRGTVYFGPQHTDCSSNTFPSIAVLGGGRWLCAFRTCPEKGKCEGQRPRVCWSDDRGATWSQPIEPFRAPSVDGKPGTLRTVAVTATQDGKVLAALSWVDQSDPALPFFNPETEGLLDTRIFISQSDDQGETWSDPVPVDTGPFEVPTPTTGPLLELPGGELICQFELNKHFHDTTPWHHRSVLKFSRDGGHSWPDHCVVTEDPENRVFYWDQRPGVLEDGSLLNLFWTFDTQDAVYLNIHASRSTDGGRTWSELWDTGVPGQPTAPVSFAGGMIAMAYVDRTGAPQIKFRTSCDGGRTWPDESEIVLYATQGATQNVAKGSMDDSWQEMVNFSVGLPAIASVSDSEVIIVYYAGTHTDHTGIHWVTIRL